MEPPLLINVIEEDPLSGASITQAIPQLPQPEQLSSDVTRNILSGTSTLAIAVLVERGATFAANIMAARFAGASVFGTYSVGISTANNISTYAAGGIGATATRFSGKYPFESGNYGTFSKVLGLVSLVSAFVAATVLIAGAPLFAHVLHKDSLTPLLRWAAIPAVGMLILECARGLFVGQRRLAALALLSVIVGTGMLLLLTGSALRKDATAMIAAHGLVTLTAVLLCCLLAKPLNLIPRNHRPGVRFATMLREVWGFGFIQLSGLLSANLAGWWITALVARGDTTLAEVGFFAVASQFRNLTGIVPALLTEGSYAAIATPDEKGTGTPQRVMALCTFASTAVAFVLACCTIVLAPWALHLMYGQRYTAASIATSIGVSVAVLQMGNNPPSARVSVVSIRSIAGINAIWALLTAVGGTLLMSHYGGAAGAMLVFFFAHVATGVLTFRVLARKDRLPAGLVPLFLLTTCSVAVLSLLAILREHQAQASIRITLTMAVFAAASCFAVFQLGKLHGWLASIGKLTSLFNQTFDKLRSALHRHIGRGTP